MSAQSKTESTITVYSNSMTPVAAKVLRDPLGNVVRAANGSAMVAPANYNPVTSANSKSGGMLNFLNYAPNFAYDLQRNYNGISSVGGKGFVGEFRDVASWDLGFSAAAKGISLETTLWSGGKVNQIVKIFNPKINTGGENDWGNNPRNAKNITNGFNAYFGLNPYPIIDKLPGNPRSISVGVVGYTGYTGPNTGYDSPSEHGPGPGGGAKPTLGSIMKLGGGAGSGSGTGPVKSTPAPVSKSTPNFYSGTGPVKSTPAPVSKPTPNFYSGSGPVKSTPAPVSKSTPNFYSGSGPVKSTPAPVSKSTPNFYSGSGPVKSTPAPVTKSTPAPAKNTQVGKARPIGIDLDGNGVAVVELGISTSAFDFNKDGVREKTAWIGRGDGLLAMDLDRSGTVNATRELAFAGESMSQDTDLEAFRANYDTDDNGVFDASDARWSYAGVWQDANQDGLSQLGEFKSLTAMGIRSISLISDEKARVLADGTEIHGNMEVAFTNGRKTLGIDVSFASSSTVEAPDVLPEWATDGSTLSSGVSGFTSAVSAGASTTQYANGQAIRYSRSGRPVGALNRTVIRRLAA
jgi:hypothetical protein